MEHDQDYTSPALPEHLHELVEELEFAAISHAEKRPDAHTARLLDAARVRLRTEIADLLSSLDAAERGGSQSENHNDSEVIRTVRKTGENNITNRDVQPKTAASLDNTDQIWEDVRATAELIHGATERALDMLGPGDGCDGLPDWKEVAAALVRVKYHAETLRLDVNSSTKVEVTDEDQPVTEEEADEARIQVVNLGLKGGFTPEAIATWSGGALVPELKRRGLLPEFDLTDNGEAAQ